MKKLLKYLVSYKKESVLAPLFKFLEACFELIVPLVVSAIIDNGITGGRGTTYIIEMCLILVALGAVGLVCAVFAQYFAAKAAAGFTKYLRRDLFNKMQSLSYSEIDRLGTSRMITRMTSDVNQVQSGVNMVLRLFMRSPVIVFGAMICAFLIDALAGGIFAIAIAVLCVIIFGILLVTIPLYRRVQGNLDGITTYTRESLTGARVIRAFCNEDKEIVAYNKQNAALKHSQTFAGWVSALMNPLTYAVINIGVIALLYTGALKVDAGTLSTGDVVALHNYISQILVELVKLANLIITVTKSFACAGRLSEVLAMQPSLKHGEKIKTDGMPYISFDGVCMKYAPDAGNALTDVSFTAERGDTIGIIGGTGSGKTTLVNLIPHFYDASSGTVCIDGINVNGYSDDEIRAKCGIVPQKAVLFNGTIAENLRWGKPDATEEELMQAVETAQAADVIRAKRDGLNEKVEQGGLNFSGGQRQRLTIARALVRKPEILILDDSASALDYATDAKLRQSLKSLDYKPTVFIVSQRTSSIRNADKIIVLDHGAVAGIGTHEELLKNCPLYREIHYSQYEKKEEAL